MAEQKVLKPLVINQKKGFKEGSENVWNKLDNPQIFIENIATPDISVEDTDINKVVSGIPSPFARTDMFKYAIEYVYSNKDGVDPTGIMSFYKRIQDEWKGLIACIALDSAPITIEKVELSYNEGKEKAGAENIFEPKGAIGNMLFEDRDLWCDQDELENKAKRPSPFIYLIRYNDVLIGGTSPETIVFTSPKYNIKPRYNLVNQRTGKFIDPLKAALDPGSIQTLYIYVSYIRARLNDYEAYFNRRKKLVDTTKLAFFLDKWLLEIENYAKGKNIKINKNALLTNINLFLPPFNILFNTETKLYGYKGKISTKQISPEAIQFDPSKLLLPHDTTTVVQFELDETFNSAKSPVYYLEAESSSGKMYFTIPLAEKGIMVFQDCLDILLDKRKDDAIKSKLKAVFDEEKNQLIVTLNLMIEDVDSGETIVKRTYSNPEAIVNKNVISWPNFISPIWNKYYCYSELPHNSSEPVRAYPLRANTENFQLIYNDKQKIPYIASIGQVSGEFDVSKLIVKFDFDKLGANPLKYEIYESDLPFKGVELKINKGSIDNQSAGYLIMKNITAMDQTALLDFRNKKLTLKEANIGIDFGSNNSCVSYTIGFNYPELIKFKNRRLFLVGEERIDLQGTKPSMPHEVFFFQNEEILGNEIKSVVMLHDEMRIDGEIAFEKEVSGGFPCFEKNIPVDKSDETTHTVNFGAMKAQLKYNMKWSPDERENSHKLGFMKTLWLKINAELIDNEAYPKKLIWAFPSAMNNSKVLKYKNLWGEVVKVNPFKNLKSAKAADHDSIDREFRALTEAEAVSNYALSGVGKMTVGGNTVSIGFDVGGSTTNILCIAQNKMFQPTLIKQSSIRVSAGKLSEATAKSEKVQNALRKFCKRNNIFIYGIEDKLNSNTASYFFNVIVDKLGKESVDSLNSLYTNIFASGCNEIFIINAYLSGIILFYAGELAAKVVNTEEFSKISNFELGFFGKGGRMFDWLPALSESKAKEYYETCFLSGFKIASTKRIKQNGSASLSDSKIGGSLKITEETIQSLKNSGLPVYVPNSLKLIVDKDFSSETDLFKAVENLIGPDETNKHIANIIKFAFKSAIGKGSGFTDIVLTAGSIEVLKKESVPLYIPNSLKSIENQTFDSVEKFSQAIQSLIGEEETTKWIQKIISSANKKEAVSQVSAPVQPSIEISRAKDIAIKMVDRSQHVKSEVSFGLSVENKLEGMEGQINELAGEIGYKFRNQELDLLEDIEPRHLLKFNRELEIPQKFVVFTEFLNVFCRFIKEQFNINLSADSIREMSFANYVENMPEFIEAKKNAKADEKDFDFEAPLIVLQGMCYLDEVLMKKVFV